MSDEPCEHRCDEWHAFVEERPLIHGTCEDCGALLVDEWKPDE